MSEGTTGRLGASQNDVASFGSFQLFPAARTLEKSGVPLTLGNRALDILMVLVERAGEVVSHKELMARAWRGLVVDPGNLRVHVSSLRKALGDVDETPRYIANVAGQGYCFVAPVTRGHAASGPARAPAYPCNAARRRLVLPPKLGRMIGRDDAIRTVATDVIADRFVTIIGPGGMGKTTVAVAVAHEMLEEFGDAVCFVDVSMVSDPKLVAATIASTLGLTIQTDDVLGTLLECLRPLRILLALDNCEHVIDASATLAELIFKEAPGVHILATSREALRVEGEHVYWLPPLDSPDPGSSMTVEDVLSFPAAKLFMERAAASGSRLPLSDDDAATLAGICGRLDGVALAIELAAGRAGTHGLRGTAELLEKGLGLHWQGRRTAHPRHQTLQALLDWSYGYLGEAEQTVLRRLAVLVGAFTLETAQAIAGDDALDESAVMDALDRLVAKSLISSMAPDNGAARYRLLETTRVYAQKKLDERGERPAIARRHAAYFAQHLGAVAGGRVDFPHDNRPPSLNDYLGNVRAALAWCFAGLRADDAVDAERARLCVELAAAAVPVLLELSLLGECYRWSVNALSLLDDTTRGSPHELALQEARAITGTWTGADGEDVRAALARGLAIARERGATTHVMRLLVGAQLFLVRSGDRLGARGAAEELAHLAESRADEHYMIIGDWMRGSSEHFLGNAAAALRYHETGFSRPGPRNVELFGLDYRVRALVTLAWVLWLTGSPERAMRTARQAIDEAAYLSKPLNVCFALLYTTPVFLSCGELAAAQDLLEQLTAHPNWRALPAFHATTLALQGELAVRRGEPERGIALLAPALGALRAGKQTVLRTRTACMLAEALTDVGRASEAYATVSDEIATLPAGDDPLDLPELLRVQAHALLATSNRDEAQAAHLLEASLACARRQSAHSAELRTAMAIARLRIRRGEPQPTRELAAVYRRFAEGLDTVDLAAARQILDS